MTQCIRHSLSGLLYWLRTRIFEMRGLLSALFMKQRWSWHTFVSLNWRLTCYKESLKSEVHLLHESAGGGVGRGQEFYSTFLLGSRTNRFELLQAYFRIKSATFIPLADLSGQRLPVTYFTPIKLNICYRPALNQNYQTKTYPPRCKDPTPTACIIVAFPFPLFHQSTYHYMNTLMRRPTF